MLKALLCKLLLLLLSNSVLFSNSLHIGPYLQNVTPTRIVIMWETVQPTVGTVEYGLSEDQLESTVIEKRSSKIHEITLVALEPGTLYYYRCSWEKEATPIHHFKTAPESNLARVKLVAYGDSRSNPAMHAKLAALIAVEAPDLVLHSGDIVADGAKLSLWKPQFFEPIQAYAPQAPIFPVLGNHEQNSVYYYNFYALNGKEAWWSTTYGPVHIIGLDSNQPGDEGTPQYEWLLEDLEAHADAPWKIVLFHHPLFNAHPDRPAHELRWQWQPLFQKYGVTLVLNGHDHYYARTLPIGIASEEPHGVVYVTSAGGGAPLYPTAPKEYIAHRRSAFHFTVLEIKNGQLIGRAIDDAGKVFDAFVIHKNATISPESFISFEMLTLKRAMEEKFSEIAVETTSDGVHRLRGKIAVPTTFEIPVNAAVSWQTPGNWKIAAEDVKAKIAPGDSLIIQFNAVAAAETVYPLPALDVEIQADNSGWTPPNPVRGFKNSAFQLNVEDALFAAALAESDAPGQTLIGFRLISQYPQSRHVPEILGQFHKLLAHHELDCGPMVNELKETLQKIQSPQQRALFYPPLFLLGDYSGWDTWLTLLRGLAPTERKAMGANLLPLIDSARLGGGPVKKWRIIGPFANKNDAGYFQAYPPEITIDLSAKYENASGQTLRWKRASANAVSYLDFTKIFREHEEGIVYAWIKVTAQKDATVPLLLGSNDAPVVWINGAEVFRLHQHRSAIPGDDVILADFKKGANDVLIKVDQTGGGWGLFLHVVDKERVLTF